jgi:hypothetical protein
VDGFNISFNEPDWLDVDEGANERNGVEGVPERNEFFFY